ncbi:MAG TPA: cytochrome c oxidase subunit II [Polyangiales bacterium]|nr:cytochrome c oxidase subunit II [Polyangiales bacterium]
MSGCTGVQSALAPSGPAARDIAELFWIMTVGGGLIFVAVLALALYAVYAPREPRSVRFGHGLILGGAVVFPTLVLGALLVYGLRMLPSQLAPAPPGSLRVHVEGLQWWWRVRYEPRAGEGFELANEIVLPRGRPVQFLLTSADVIHSFWIPSLAGKVDMIPGRATRLAVTATRAGEYRGACAEYCGTSHAWMAFSVRVLEPADFDAWLAGQRAPARVVAEAEPGRRAFAEYGCGACHTVRGEVARASLAPDLTHVGSRLTLGAGLFSNDDRSRLRWLTNTDVVKPGVHMPAFGMVPAARLRDLSVYLGSLQ